ncbi:hypothetical protein IWW34DRAFT_794362 [Fusarium oxysporum f. sp. albedinis]|nr:hypothetical protein IWW34DRAFT_794362 [Fusarium oxysporum f. sp. albedinis]
MDKLIQQNDKNFIRATNERSPKEKRSEVKSEKERLLRPQKAFKQLTAPTDEYRALCRKREELTQDEVRLDDLIDEIQAVEHVLLKTIDGTGLDVADFLGTVQKPTHGRPPASVIVKDTQPMFQKSANMSMMSNVATLASEMDTAKPSNAPYQSRPATRSSMADPMPVDAEFDVDDDGFSNLDELQLQPVLKAVRNLAPVSRSPPQATHRHPGDEFSDSRDDEEMLAFAQDDETRQSHVPISQDFREVVSETTEAIDVSSARVNPWRADETSVVT